MFQQMKHLDWSMTPLFQATGRAVVDPLASLWEWLTGSPCPCWSLLGTCSGLFSDPAWKICAWSRCSPSHPIQSWALAPGGRELEYTLHRSFLHLRVQGMLEEILRADTVSEWWKDGLGCTAEHRRKPVPAEWFLGCCLPNAPRKQINWQWLGNVWSMPKLWNSSPHSWVLQSFSGVWQVEILLFPLLFASVHLNCGNPFAVLIRKQLIPC